MRLLDEVVEVVEAILLGLSRAEVDELAGMWAIMPIRMAESISARLAHG